MGNIAKFATDNLLSSRAANRLWDTIWLGIELNFQRPPYQSHHRIERTVCYRAVRITGSRTPCGLQLVQLKKATVHSTGSRQLNKATVHSAGPRQLKKAPVQSTAVQTPTGTQQHDRRWYILSGSTAVQMPTETLLHHRSLELKEC